MGRILNLATLRVACEFRFTKLGRFILRAKQTQDLLALRLLYARQDSREPGQCFALLASFTL